MWELSTAMVNDRERVEELLREGHEPFAITEDIRGERIWFKRKVAKSAFREQQSEDKQGASRGATAESKAKD